MPVMQIAMQHLVSSFIFLVILLVASSPLEAQTPTVTSCRVGVEAPAFGFWTWAPHSAVKVYIRTADFQSTELPYLLAPVRNWNAVSDQTASGVRFVYLGGTSAPLACENCLTIVRGPVFDRTKLHASELRAYSARRDQIMTYATIVIDPVLTNPKALTNAIAHELGHNFGLLDCFTCKQKSTVMNQFKVMNVPNDMEGPTVCDIAQVMAAYKELAARLRPSPQSGLVQDDGEEPIDDNTPIVVPRP
jgi:hypothetical protein